MIKLIKTPCLPEGSVRSCLIGEKYYDEISELEQLGINTFILKTNPLLDDEVNCHADMLSFNFGNGQALLNNGSIGEIVLKNIGIEPVFYGNEITSPYPKDIPLNVAFTGRHIICNTKYTAKEIIDFANGNNIEIICTKQGYTKCNLCIVNENAVITEDKALAYLLKNYQYNVLEIQAGDIYLSDKHYGFLGGASCKVSPDRLYFSGNLSCHRDYNRIMEFLDLYNVKPIFNNLRKLTDFGGIIQLTEEI